jgi:hypothetical protein
MKRSLGLLSLVVAFGLPLYAHAASDKLAMHQPFHLAGFEYTLTSISWYSKTNAKAGAVLKEPACHANGTNGVLAFTFTVKSEQQGEAAAGQLVVAPQYKDGCRSDDGRNRRFDRSLRVRRSAADEKQSDRRSAIRKRL